MLERMHFLASKLLPAAAGSSIGREVRAQTGAQWLSAQLPRWDDLSVDRATCQGCV